MVQKSPGRAFGVLAAVAAAGIVLSMSLRTGGAEKPQAKRCVVVWSEGTAPKSVYPNNINGAIAEGLRDLKGWEVIKVCPGPLLAPLPPRLCCPPLSNSLS